MESGKLVRRLREGCRGAQGRGMNLGEALGGRLRVSHTHASTDKLPKQEQEAGVERQEAASGHTRVKLPHETLQDVVWATVVVM